MAMDALIPVIVFIAVYILIAFEWLNKAVAAILGVMALVVLNIIDVPTAAGYIDYETIMSLPVVLSLIGVLAFFRAANRDSFKPIDNSLINCSQSN